MKKHDAIGILNDVTDLTDHPFSDFSSLPIVFMLRRISEQSNVPSVIVECNGGDDCFGFPDLINQSKFKIKHRFPKAFKKTLAFFFKSRPYWKWKSHEAALARLAALADVHEITALNYFLVLTPVNYLGIEVPHEWDVKLEEVMETVFSNCGKEYNTLGYKAKTTIRQLLHVNSRRWAAKALSVGESLGLRLVYPYIWYEVLVEQGKLPWNAKIYNGTAKWPLKKLLEDFMPDSFIYRKKSGFVPPFAKWLTDREFNDQLRDILLGNNGKIREIVPAKTIDQLLSDATSGKRLRHSILNFLWGAVFVESWIQKYGQIS